MKAAKINQAEKFYFLVVVILFLILTVNTFGQTQKVLEVTKHKYAYQNLVIAIHSDNPGVRESAVYFVGEYRFIDLEDELIKQLRVEDNSDIKILIGLALFRLKSEKGLDELQKLMVNDHDKRVRRMSRAIYNEYYVSSFNKTVDAKWWSIMN